MEIARIVGTAVGRHVCNASRVGSQASGSATPIIHPARASREGGFKINSFSPQTASRPPCGSAHAALWDIELTPVWRVRSSWKQPAQKIRHHVSFHDFDETPRRHAPDGTRAPHALLCSDVLKLGRGAPDYPHPWHLARYRDFSRVLRAGIEIAAMGFGRPRANLPTSSPVARL